VLPSSHSSSGSAVPSPQWSGPGGHRRRRDGAAAEVRVDCGDQLLDLDLAVAVHIGRRAAVDAGAAERDLDADDELVDDDAAVAVAVAGTGEGGKRREEHEQNDGAEQHAIIVNVAAGRGKSGRVVVRGALEMRASRPRSQPANSMPGAA
jgi:hypothetical protein